MYSCLLFPKIYIKCGARPQPEKSEKSPQMFYYSGHMENCMLRISLRYIMNSSVRQNKLVG
jgi:hypothetical protein